MIHRLEFNKVYHIRETFKLINIQFYQNVQYHRFIYWQEDKANYLNWEVKELFYKKCSSLSYCNVMNGVNIEIPDNRNISRITIFNPPSAAQHQMESSHAWIEMSLNGFSCWTVTITSVIYLLSAALEQAADDYDDMFKLSLMINIVWIYYWPFWWTFFICFCKFHR